MKTRHIGIVLAMLLIAGMCLQQLLALVFSPMRLSRSTIMGALNDLNNTLDVRVGKNAVVGLTMQDVPGSMEQSMM